MNARNYQRELAEETNAVEHLHEILKVFDRSGVTPVYGMKFAGSGYKLQMPIIGRVVKSIINRVLHNEGPKRRHIGVDGHFGQVLPIEDASYIVENLAAEPLTLNYCVCRYMCRGEKEARCLIFGVMSEIADKIPRYIPENVKRPMDREEATRILEGFSEEGLVSTVWFHPVPYITAICSCEDPNCMGIRMRQDYDIGLLYKAEYVIQLNPDLCEGQKDCVSACQFGALSFSPTKNRVIVNFDKCYGCGNCRNVCKYDALSLVPRDTIKQVAGRY
jgi:NAD-dependent dihydropyrimidine dehydrogenase PreA subunit